MTLETLFAQIQIEGPVKIQCWEDEDYYDSEHQDVIDCYW